MKTKRILPDSIEVSVDSNEHDPLIYPPSIFWKPARHEPAIHLRVRVVRERLSYGDNALRGLASVSCVERKRGFRELAQNLASDDATRAGVAFRRLRDNCAHPYILLDSRWTDLDEPPNWPASAPRRHTVLDTFFQMCAAYGFGILGPMSCRTEKTRRLAGELVVRVLLAHCYPSADFLAAAPSLVVPTVPGGRITGVPGKSEKSEILPGSLDKRLKNP